MELIEELAKLLFEQQYPRAKWEHAATGPFGLKTIYKKRAESVINFFDKAGWTDAEGKAMRILETLTKC